MEENDDREGGVGFRGRFVETEPEGFGVVDGEVGGCNASDWFFGRSGFGVD